MLDIKDEPDRHINFLVYSLKIFTIQNEIDQLRLKSSFAKDDNLYDKIVLLQQELAKYKIERSKVS